MKVYIASSWSNAEAARKATKQLIDAGYSTTQTWPWAQGVAGSETYGESRDWAIRDMEQIQDADVVLLLNDVPSSTGGMHFEAGYAYAEKKWLVVIGPSTSIFFDLPWITHFATVEDFIKGNWNGGRYHDAKRA